MVKNEKQDRRGLCKDATVSMYEIVFATLDNTAIYGRLVLWRAFTRKITVSRSSRRFAFGAG